MDKDYDIREHPVGNTVITYSWKDHVLPFGPSGSPFHYINVPLTFRNKLCFGVFGPAEEKHSYEFSDIRSSSNRGKFCRNCGRYPSYTIRKCINCSDIFIKDFSSSKYCDLFPYCWKCLPELPWTHCPYHLSPSGRYHIEEGPLKVNPKTFTQEELDSFDLFSFDLFAES